MIYGIGTDIVLVDRIRRDLDRFGEAFAERILSHSELAEFHDNNSKANFLARRFAAKEAAVKAMGTGFTNGIRLRDITVTHDDQGKPALVFSGQAMCFIQENGINATHISLADEQDHAVAFVTFESL